MRCSEVDMEQKNAIRQVAVPWAGRDRTLLMKFEQADRL